MSTNDSPYQKSHRGEVFCKWDKLTAEERKAWEETANRNADEQVELRLRQAGL